MKPSDGLIGVKCNAHKTNFMHCSYIKANKFIFYIIYVSLQNGDNIESEIERRQTAAPYIVQAGPSTARQHILIVESLIYMEVDHLLQAVAAILGLYYIYDITYPKQWNNCLLFIEKKLIGISSGPSLGPLQAGLISDIEKLP